MNGKWKIAIIATVVLLGIGTVVFAQTAGDSRQKEGQQAPLNLDESSWCGQPRGGSPYDGDSYDDESGSGNGGRFSCH